LPPAAPRGTTELDLSAVPPLDPAVRPPLLDGRSYRPLTADECQCLASQNASLAGLLDGGKPGCACDAHKAELVQSVQALAAEETRNRTAGLALEAYYRLAEAEGRAELLRDSQVEVDALLASAEELYAKKLVDAAEVSAARRQSADLVADGLRLQVGIDQLNASLQPLLGLGEACEDWSIWPADPLRVTPPEQSPEELVKLGLAHRPDLAILRTLNERLDKKTLPVVVQFLATLNPLLTMKSGGPLCTLFLAIKECFCGEGLAMAQRQLQTLLRDRERQATEEIRQSAREVELRLWLVSAARQRLEVEQRKADEVREKHAKELATDVEVRKASLEILKARRELLSEVVNWHIAVSQLRQRQGVLAQECASASASPDCGHTHPAPSR
jgi:outer membrane protein TolC